MIRSKTILDTDFLKHLRQALNHLYNRDFLRKSPLVSVFGISSRSDPAAVLQRILLDGIEALKPTPADPLRSEKRKMYEILLYRYIQQFNQDEVAHHTGVSERQFRREQDKAVDYLGEHLLGQYANQPGTPPKLKSPLVEEGSPRQNEWDWLREHPAESITELKSFVLNLLDLMLAVAGQHQVELQPSLSGSLPDLAVHPIALRQMLLNLLQVAIYHAARGMVTIEAEASEKFVQFRIQSHPQEQTISLARDDQESNLIKIAAHLAEISGGRLDVQQSSGRFSSTLALPVVDGICVLIIDDHPEIIDLLQRYAMGTRYRITGITDPEKTFERIAAAVPQVIVLDVMMPKIDGWEMLGRLRIHPQTAEIPIIILTILAQEDLALSLGAKALVLKPVTQERFLAALDTVSARQGSSSR